MSLTIRMYSLTICQDTKYNKQKFGVFCIMIVTQNLADKNDYLNLSQ